MIKREDRDPLLQRKSVLSVKKGHKIYTQKQIPNGFYQVNRGLIGLLINDINGKERMIRLYDDGGYFGCRSFISSERYHSSSIALTDATIIHYQIHSPKELMLISPDSFYQITLALSKELGEAEHRLSKMAKKVKIRVIDTLLHLLNRYPNYRWTRREIAEFCGCEPETAIRICRSLEKSGLISSAGRQIKITDEKALQALRDI
ncbi:hypothetical protein ACH42_04390 [Endozoicomonas sp. (ex Bugula neritina AB1)]|nr:hypothetical protein ACH42_04390 [Endozoicomonas sp. (ex Bugula neritina AB1)]